MQHALFGPCFTYASLTEKRERDVSSQCQCSCSNDGIRQCITAVGHHLQDSILWFHLQTRPVSALALLVSSEGLVQLYKLTYLAMWSCRMLLRQAVSGVIPATLDQHSPAVALM